MVSQILELIGKVVGNCDILNELGDSCLMKNTFVIFFFLLFLAIVEVTHVVNLALLNFSLCLFLWNGCPLDVGNVEKPFSEVVNRVLGLFLVEGSKALGNDLADLFGLKVVSIVGTAASLAVTHLFIVDF